ncbi:MAG: argininosuccinate synthase [Thermodesulfobacteriota bacterium]
MSKSKIVLAYSGGLDTSIILKWLLKEYDSEIIAYVADLGQGEDIKAIEKKAYDTGASAVFIEDLKEEFVRDYVFPSIKANAIYEGVYLLGTSIARPLIAKRQIEIAEREGAFAVSHGATGKGNDQVRFELTFYALNPGIKVIAPWREWDFKSRNDLINFANDNGIEVPVTKDKPYSCDRNLLHISYEGGILEDPWAEPPETMFEMTRSPENAPDKPTYLEIEFESGVPVKVNNKKLSPVELLRTLNKVAGENAVGRVDLVENRFVGMKSRGVYETPGGTVLHIAHRALESLTLDREVMHLKDSMIPKIAELIYYGFWFSPEMEMLMAAVNESQKNVTGKVNVKLYKGNVIIAGRKSDYSLYSQNLATFEEDDVYNQADATGFIKLNALRLSMRKLIEKK